MLRRRTKLKAGKGLERRSRLASHKKSLRASKGIWAAWRWQEGEVVHSWLWCQVAGCGQVGTEVHHPYGRTHEPWASSRLVCVLLCHDHHQAITGRVGLGMVLKLRDDMRWLGLEKARGYVNDQQAAAGRQHVEWLDEHGNGLPRRFTYLVSVARANGITPPFWRESLKRSA